jgi:hypothetical protein
MRLLLGLALAAAALSPLGAHAQSRIFNQAELDALLAPIALYPDPLVNQVLDASLYPDEVAQAAAWSRANPQLNGDAAVQFVQQSMPWQPSVKALVAYPEVLARMGESPQWVADLGQAYATHGAYIQATVQQLRARAQASGYLQSDQYQQVYTQGEQIVVQPVYPNVVYVPYYNPFVVYGTWWWPAYRPVYWRPWVSHPVYVARPWHAVQPWRAVPVRAAPVGRFERRVEVTPYHAVPESQRRPIIGSPPSLAHPVINPPSRPASVSRPMTPRDYRPMAQVRPQTSSRPTNVGHFHETAQARPHVNMQAAPVSRFSASRGASGGGSHRR